MKKRFGFVSLLAIFIIILAACSDDKTMEEKTKDQNVEQNVKETTAVLEYNPPKMEDLEGKDDPLSESIKYGYDLIMETNTLLDGYVNNQLSCASCHAGGGYDQVSSLVGVTTQFPQYRPREGVIFTIEDRINGCMVRSMNGEKIPYDSKEMRAMVSYLTYISEGIPTGADIPWRMQNTMKEYPEPNVTNGEELYNQSCLACHGANGEGIGPNTGPALWGPNSFNDGAGMARMSKMSGFIQRNMPIGQENTLTDQQAADLAAYILSHERPKWEGRENDWPKGGAPKDVPYFDELKSMKEENSN